MTVLTREQVRLEVVTGAMAEAGHVFHRSANGVWLTAVVAPSFLRERSE
jgi:putative RNA 2'-phosphotransferase